MNYFYSKLSFLGGFLLFLVTPLFGSETLPVSPWAWYRADEGVTEKEGAVGGWKDHSGKRGDFLPSQGLAVPLLERDWRNGKPALRFSGNEVLATADMGQIFNDWCIYIVAEVHDSAKPSQIILNYGEVGRNLSRANGGFCFMNGTSAFAGAGISIFSRGTRALEHNISAVNWMGGRKAKLGEVIYNGDGLAEAYANGVKVGEVQRAEGGNLPSRSLHVGGVSGEGRVWLGLVGAVAEIIIFDKTLDDQEREVVRGYLMKKYQIAQD